MRPVSFSETQHSFNPLSSNMVLRHQQLSPFDAFNKYLQTYTTAFHFHQQIKIVKKRRNQLVSRIARLQDDLQKNLENNDSKDREVKPKRKRRLATEIEKQFVCPNERCNRNYGTFGSLQQHLRLKHGEMFESGKVGSAFGSGGEGLSEQRGPSFGPSAFTFLK